MLNGLDRINDKTIHELDTWADVMQKQNIIIVRCTVSYIKYTNYYSQNGDYSLCMNK